MECNHTYDWSGKYELRCTVCGEKANVTSKLNEEELRIKLAELLKFYKQPPMNGNYYTDNAVKAIIQLCKHSTF